MAKVYVMMQGDDLYRGQHSWNDQRTVRAYASLSAARGAFTRMVKMYQDNNPPTHLLELALEDGAVVE